jgi:tRNA dimethylallyltransferase
LTLSKTLYVLTGPTAAGKTAVSIQLAKKLQTAVISADSRQCYTEMSIGTAKPSQGELQQVKHYFISAFPVTTSLTAADYETLALGYLQEIFQQHDEAVVCGGTGLYIKALCEGLDEMPDVDETIAAEADRLYKTNGLEWLQQTVQNEDPEFYEAGEIKNPARLLRALIFKRSAQQSIIHFHSRAKKQRPFRIIKAGLELPREIMYTRINERVDEMMGLGLLDEVKKLYPLRHLKNLQTVGYTELFDYLDNKCTLGEAISKIKQNTRNYAKRQMTWFRKDKEIQWFRADDEDLAEKILALR